MTNIELPSTNELFMADQVRDALRSAEGSSYEGRLSELLFEMLADMLYSETLAFQVMKMLGQAVWLPASTAIRRLLEES